jgi:hypothetical protein
MEMVRIPLNLALRNGDIAIRLRGNGPPWIGKEAGNKEENEGDDL